LIGYDVDLTKMMKYRKTDKASYRMRRQPK